MAAQTLAPVESVEAGITGISWIFFWSSCATKKSIAELFLGLRFRVLGLGLHNCTTRQLMAAQTLAPVESVEAGIS